MLAQCVHRDTHSYFSEGVHSNKQTKITETLKKLSRIFFNMTICSYNRLKSEVSNSRISNIKCNMLMVKVRTVQYVCDI